MPNIIFAVDQRKPPAAIERREGWVRAALIAMVPVVLNDYTSQIDRIK